VAVKSCVQEEGDGRLSPSSTLCCGCVHDEIVLRYRFHHHVCSLAEAVWTSSYDCSMVTTSSGMVGVRLCVLL